MPHGDPHDHEAPNKPSKEKTKRPRKAVPGRLTVAVTVMVPARLSTRGAGRGQSHPPKIRKLTRAAGK
eukprot:9481929-Pyramimonas_sp.AAC.1